MTRSDAPRLADYLGHILQAIGRIKGYVQGMDEAAFSEDHRTQDAVIRNFEIIGEASKNIEKRHPEFAQDHADVPWAVAYEMDPCWPSATGWQAETDQRVSTVTSHGDSVFIGGSFETVNESSRARMAGLDALDGSLNSDWDPAFGFRVFSTIVDADRNRLYGGGWLRDVDGKSRGRFVNLNLETGEIVW